MGLNIIYHSVEAVKALCGLRIEVNVARIVKTRHVFNVLHHYGFATCLAHQAQHFGMSVLSENHNLCLWVGVELLFYSPLQLQHHGTGGIYYVDMVFLGKSVGLWRLAMSTQQHLHVMQTVQLFVVDSHETIGM